MINRKIPATMVSQHPDHAGKPFWHHKEFISTRQESRECFISLSELNASEYKWDWEGKLVDESVLERLLTDHFDFFKKNELGKNKFLTFRLPNIRVETEFRLGRAFMGLLSAAGLAKQVGLHSPPLFEVILPMTETAEEMIDVQEAFQEVASLKHRLHHFANGSLKHIEIIPLFEQVETMMNSDKILEEYLQRHKNLFGFTPPYLRPYLARSDPALNSGLVATVLAIKVALSRYKQLSEKTGVELFPIIGSASLPFRGGLTPHTVSQFSQEYAGIRTALLQSAFRYDFDLAAVKQAITFLETNLPRGEAANITPAATKKLMIIINVFERYYQETVEVLAKQVNAVAAFIPQRRERVQHIGLFGYSRNVGAVTLPRAIGFTGSMYSLGLPPELIGTGRGLKQIIKLGLLPLLEKHYLFLRHDLERAGGFLNKELLNQIIKQNPQLKPILTDIKEVEKYLGKSIGPNTQEQQAHAKLTETIYQKIKNGEDVETEMNEAAILRKSIG